MLAEPAIDEDVLARNTSGDRVLATELLQLFRQTIMPDVRRLVGEADPDDRAGLAHRVKGAALAIGALRLAGLADGAARREGLAAYREALDALDRAIAARVPDGRRE